MVDTRLLDHLYRADKDFSQAFDNLFVLSHASITALSAYGASTAPPTSQAIMDVSAVLISVDQALRKYVGSIDDWRDKVKEVKRIDGEISHIMRDREILITRLLKASKQKPNRESMLSQANPAQPTMSTQSLSIAKLALAQQELQACELTLAQKQAELDEVTRSAVKDGLERRCRALIECGYSFSEKGREGLIALDILHPPSPSRQLSPPANGHASPYVHHPVPRPFSLNGFSGGSTSSLAPSQSASNIAQEVSPANDAQPSKPRSPREANAPLPSIPQGALPPQSDARPMSPYKLDIRPAHSIEDHVYPAGHLVEGEDQGEIELNSSDEDDRQLEVHENAPRAAAPIVVPPPKPTTVEVISQPSSSGVRRKLSHRSAKGKAKETSEIPPSLPTTTPTTSRIKPPTVKAPPPLQNHLHKPSTMTGTEKHKRDFSSSTNRSSNYQPSSGDSRKRSGSFSLFGGLAGLFHRGSNSKGGFAESPPPSPSARTNMMTETRGGGWSTRTDQNIRSAREDLRNGGGDSSSEDERRKVKYGQLVEVKNTRTADTNGINGSGSVRKSSQTTGSRFRMRRSPTSPAIKEKPEKNTSGRRSTSLDRGQVVNGERSEGATVVRRLSKHSSDGALHSKAAAANDTPANVEPPTASPTRSAPAKIRKRTRSRSGGKKNFADGLGSAGGALVIGGSEANTQAATEQSTPLGSSAAVSRSNTARSTNTVASTAPDFVGKPTSMEVVGQSGGVASDSSHRTGTAPVRRSSLQYEVKPDSNTAGPSGPPPPAKKMVGKPKNAANAGAAAASLMSIVEGVSSKSNSGYVPKLEIVRAPPSVTATPILYNPPPTLPHSNGTPRSSMDTPGAGPSKAYGTPSSLAGVFAPKLVLPSTLDHPVVAPQPMAPDRLGPLSSGAKTNGQSEQDHHHHSPIPSALSPAPLRSALRTRSPSPAIQPQANVPGNGHAFTSAPTAPAPPPVPAREPTPPLPPPPVPTKREFDSSQPRPPSSHRMSIDSISSYETGHEDFDEEEVEIPSLRIIPAPEPTPGTTSNVLASHITASLENREEKKGTDLSMSTDSTSVPKRQKSVRMALPPSVSSTPASSPAALKNGKEPDHWDVGTSGGREASRSQEEWSSRISRNGVRDMWEDNSDEDADYGRARKALMRATKGLEHAEDLVPKRKRNAGGGKAR